MVKTISNSGRWAARARRAKPEGGATTVFKKMTPGLACFIGVVVSAITVPTADAVAKHTVGHAETHGEKHGGGHGGGHAVEHSEKTVKTAVHLTGELSMRSQMISAETLFVALGVDSERRLHVLEDSCAFFERILAGLRRGDESLGLPAVQSPEALAQLDRIEELWYLLYAAVQKGLDAGSMGPEQVDTIASLNLGLLREADRMVELLKEEAARLRFFSMLVKATDLSGRQHTLIRRMAKEFLLIAYGHDAETHRESLVQTYALFERNLNGLIDGDAQMKLLPPPTPEIQSQLQRVEETWRRFLPLMQAATQGRPGPEAVAQVARQVAPLAEEMEEVVHLLEAL